MRAGRADERELVAQARREVAREAAHAVAALLDLAAVGVEDSIARVGAVGRVLAVDEQQLIEADAAAAIGPAPHELGGRRSARARPRQHHEVVAEAVHLGESELHRCAGGGGARRRK